MGITTWQAEKERQGPAGAQGAGSGAVVVPAVRQLKVNYRTHNGILAAAGSVVNLIQVLHLHPAS